VTGVPDDTGVDRDPGRIEAMFSGIAGRYDLMNRLMTAGLDRRWRAAAADAAALGPGDEALDVCSGTGDLALELARRYPRAAVLGVDFSAAMLARARGKAALLGNGGAPLTFAVADLMALPFEDGRFAAVTVAFGVRNVPDLPRALREMVRVTAPGGRVVVLEITPPRGEIGRRFHALWFDRFVPRLGAVVASDAGAYAYLPASVRAFPAAEDLATMLVQAGLSRVRFRRFGLGIIALHAGIVSNGREAER
jgi:demethylmenaquinone methyltransferase/2-methoxy-6-polyprenyl-1,4-benzoquinol methylase